jgi:uncharacterized membrane protein YkvA (DUF1232 family)
MPKVGEIPSLLQATPSMLRDSFKRKYRKTPWGTLTGGVFSILYLLNPLDLIPEALPLIGIVDDTLVFGVFLALLSRDVKKYLLWKSSHEKSNSNPKKPDSGIPNWLFYSGIGMVLSLGAAKVFFGILRLYR